MSGRSDAIPLQPQSRNGIENNEEEAAKEFKEGPLEEIRNPHCCYIQLARKRPCAEQTEQIQPTFMSAKSYKFACNVNTEMSNLKGNGY